MNSPTHLKLARDLARDLERQPFSGESPGTVPASHYTSDAHFALEQRAVFSRLPVPVAHVSELGAPGDVVTGEIGGVPLIVVCGPDGIVRAFRNACRHRSTQLVSDSLPCPRVKSFVCPYHAWTYDLTGRLVHVPHRDAFLGQEASRSDLIPAYAATAHGFVWVSLAPFDLGVHLAPIADELVALGAAGWSLYRRETREVAGNWKLIIDAFLEAYHLRQLHRTSVSRFFLDARFTAEPAGLHIRAATARRELKTAAAAFDWERADPRALVTPSTLVFPTTTLVMHPDFTSVLTLTPLSATRTRFVHSMYLEARVETPEAEAHWAKSFALIDGEVFGAEDLGAVEAIQRGLRAQADDTLLFGQLEAPVLWFHQTLAQQLSQAAALP